MRFTTAFPIFECADLGVSLQFYAGLLGFAVTYRFPDEDAGGDPEFVALSLPDGSSIGLAAAKRDATTDRDATADREATAGPRGFELCVYAEDTDQAIEELRVAGVPVLVEPTDQPWGERMAYVADPDGNRVHVACQLK